MPYHEWTLNHTGGRADFYEVGSAAKTTEVEVFFEGAIGGGDGRVEQLLPHVIHHAHLHFFPLFGGSADVDQAGCRVRVHEDGLSRLLFQTDASNVHEDLL